MSICKRIMAFVLSLLMLISICYVEMPKTKAVNTEAMKESFVSWYVKTFSSDENIEEQEAHLNELLNNDLMSAMQEITVGAIHGVLDSQEAIGIVIDNAIGNATTAMKEKGVVGSFFGLPDAWQTVKKSFVRGVECYRNGGSIPGAFKTAAIVTSADRLEESQEIADVMAEAESILDSYVYRGSLGTGNNGVRLKAAAWLVCQEIRAMQIKGYSDLAIIGAMCNAKAESGFDPAW